MKKLIAVIVVLLAACGSSTTKAAQPNVVTPSTTTAAPDIAAFGQKYLDIVKPANDAGAAFYDKVKAMSVSATGADVYKEALPFIAASQTQDQALLRVAWPANIVPDVRALVAADTVEVGDLASLTTQTTFTLPAWSVQWQADLAKGSAAASIVRADLGLPPPKV